MKKLAFPLLAASGLLLSFGTQGSAASFSCGSASAPDTRAICADAGLSQKDQKLDDLYRTVGSQVEGRARAELAVSHYEWLQKRAQCNSDPGCLESAYNERTKQLQTHLAKAGVSNEVTAATKPAASTLDTFRRTAQCGKDCNLAGADLRGIEPAKTGDDGKMNCTVNGVASGVFDGARINHANFVSCNTKSESALDSMSWDGASLKDTNFTGTNLGGNSFKGANLTGANLSDANLFWVNMSGATLKRANLTGAQSTPDAMNGLCSDFTNADFSEAKLHKANLCGSFYNANFTGANLRNAKIYGHAQGVSDKAAGQNDVGPVPSDAAKGAFGGKINLTGADLRGATLFTETKLTRQGYRFAILCRTKMPDGKTSNRDCKK
ncbi:hypothetical protein GCM10011491_13650 [Brucella endophytica]|uniref:Pentapeptide repeat-containing protein n=1 Tax=Brucella endophytica TaxID=1963359 RepID=A0A916S6X9_9HYPH|nr:pentapeptide repeat-containing protein [Brucella endophytica]GGA87244.1 hypothetical protein GCM10011491_13650 [Brucella endophytica]